MDESQKMSFSPSISSIWIIFGGWPEVYPVVERIYKEIEKIRSALRERDELIIVLHGSSWLRSFPFASRFDSKVKVIAVAENEELPALLFNAGALEARGDYLAFGWPGIDLSSWLECQTNLRRKLPVNAGGNFYASHPEADKVDEAHGPPCSWKYRSALGILPGYPGGWLEMIDYVPMSCSLVARDFFLSSGGFSCSPILQRGFWWEFTVRFARVATIEQIETAPPDLIWAWDDFPLSNALSLSCDLVARRVVRSSASPQEVMLTCDWNDVALFSVDLTEASRARLERTLAWLHTGSAKPPVKGGSDGGTQQGKSPKAPIRVVVLGGLNEPAHNQLCFFNYFSLLEGQGKLTWRAILDEAAQPIDLFKADLVVFSRVKSERGCQLMDYCVANRIPTIYMLDDNWFSVGQDWPEYATLFTPGAPLFERFMYCLKRADYVLTYNNVLAEDLRPHSKSLQMLPTNIDLSLFPVVERGRGQRLRVGYVGSLRKEDSAFIALSQLVRDRDDFDVFVMSATIPASLSALPQDRLIFRPYVFGYRRYAQVLCEAKPDILLAPLEKTRTDASKCPNKYLEITAAGAVGVYSRTPPYDHFIESGQNGLLVDNEAATWKEAIQGLLDNTSLRKHLLSHAAQDVRANFDTPVILPAFWQFLQQAAAANPVPGWLVS